MMSASVNWRSRIFGDSYLKLISLLIALLLWVMVLANREVVMDWEIPLDYRSEKVLDMDEDLPQTVHVRLSASRRMMKDYAPKEKLEVDLRGLEPGVHRIVLEPSWLDLPDEIQLLSLKPDMIVVPIKGRSSSRNK